jgi:uncharacterized protein
MTRTVAAALLLLCAAAAPPPPAAALSLEQLDGPALPGQPAAPPGVTPWDTLGKTTVSWNDDDTVTTLVPPEVEALDGRQVKLTGFMVPIEVELPMRQFLLIEYPADCAFCAATGTDPSRVVEVQSSSGIDWLDEQVTVSGRLEVVRNDLDGLVYRLHEAKLAE